MTILSDKTITELSTYPYSEKRYADSVWHNRILLGIDNQEKPLIVPFFPESVRISESGEKIASYGLSSYGYDIRCAPEFKIFKGPPADGILDYKQMDSDLFETVEADSVVIPPNGFILSRSLEYITMPSNVMALCIGKSTIARAGINCLCTPLEPGWEGYITLEFSNTTQLPNRFYANEGVLQLVFFQGDRVCETSYRDRQGKYQSQAAEIVLPIV